ncbi:MAG: hypothetical protein CL677_01135 [Bdellovibrionaceae bacterium]|nr:hypothetical protein [Pseudobdellovibrionaceae bacterium]|tara:strand:- start:485 stop:709 length:225 start_codon:yes stop_codon:yes gene_type:complete
MGGYKDMAIDLKALDTEIILDEAVSRLRVIFQEKCGTRKYFGFAKILFHSGKYAGMELCPRIRKFPGDSLEEEK